MMFNIRLEFDVLSLGPSALRNQIRTARLGMLLHQKEGGGGEGRIN